MTNTDNFVPSLRLSETFYSIQGEGRQTGCPSIFIRLTGCNLACGFSAKGISALKKHVDTVEGYCKGGTDHEYADLYKEGKATWVCDSASVWLKGKETPITDLIDSWKKDGLWSGILDGTIHLIWTGGEPTMPQHQKAIYASISFMEDLAAVEGNQHHMFHEIETNGTYAINPTLFNKLSQVNCSVKLANSGMSAERRIKPEVIKHYVRNHHICDFKFVVSNKEDFDEIMRDFVTPFGIQKKNVLLQPGCDRLADLSERTKFCFELAKEYQFRGMTRAHVLAWGEVTGV